MSKIKELKNLESNNINLISLLQELLVNKKTKYVDLFYKLMNNKEKEESVKEYLYKELYERFPKLSFSDDLSIIELLVLQTLVNWIGKDDIDNMNLLSEYNERSLLEKNDITTYKRFEDLTLELSKVEIKMIGKEMETQIIKLFEDDEWLILKPLTFESSKKYGSSTKWCTTSANNPEHFFRYTRDGILTYCLNKKTGYKVAAYKNIKEREITFWNQRDERIDSFYSELSDELMVILRKDFKTCDKPNGRLIDPTVREKEIKLHIQKEAKIARLNPPEVTERKIKIDNRYEDEMEAPNSERIESEPSIGSEYPSMDEDMLINEIVENRNRGYELKESSQEYYDDSMDENVRDESPYGNSISNNRPLTRDFGAISSGGPSTYEESLPQRG